MKKMNTVGLAFTVAGSILGAGYVSGQELYQFFGTFGLPGYVGAVLAPLLFCVLGAVLVKLSRAKSTSQMDVLIIPSQKRIFRDIFSFSELFFLFGICVVMTAGAGSLFEQVFHIPSILASGIFAVCISLVAIAGVSGMVTAFSVTVPLMVAVTAVVFVLNLLKNGVVVPEASTGSRENPLLANWFISALVYVSFNFFASVGIIAPIGQRIPSKKTFALGFILGGVFLSVLALSILYTLSVNEQAVTEDLPMLYAAKETNLVLYYFFALLLLMGMFGTSVASLFAVSDYLKNRFSFDKKKSLLTVFVLALCIFLDSMFGFQKLIGILYPICGYLGFVAIAAMLANFFMFKRKKQTASAKM